MLVFPSNPNTGDVFGQWQWDGHKWTRAGSASFALETLADVSITSLLQDQTLSWDADTEKWVNVSPPIPLLSGLSDVLVQSPANGQMLTWDGSRWVNGGNALITGVGTAQMALTVTGVTGQQTADFIVPAGANGLSVAGPGTSPSNWQFNVGNGNDALLQIKADGSGWLGPNSVANLSWNTAGNFTINVPTSGIAFRVNGAMNTTASEMYGNPNGLFIQAGNNMAGPASDYWCLNVTTAALGGLLRIQCDGSGILGRLNWTTAGNFTINPPQPGYTALQVYGGFAPTSVAAFQALGGVNGPGLYINMQDSPSKVSLIASGYNIPGSFAIGFANGEVLNFGGGSVATFSAPYVQVPNMASTGVTGLPYVVIDGNGNLLRWGATSSLRYKTNIRSVAREQARAVLGKLRAITYTSTIEGDDPERVSYGLIAEEVAEVDPRLVHYKEGKPESVIYDRVVMLLLPLMQELLGLDEPEGEHSDVSFSAKS